MKVHICLSGDPGSGKSTVAKLLCEKLQAQYFSTGSIQRELAQERGVTTLELNTLSETDPSIDALVDAKTKMWSQVAENIVVDSRLAWFFLPYAFKVYVVCSPEVAAKRVFAANRTFESYATATETLQALQLRRDSENIRYLRYYKVMPSNLRNFDLVVDSSYATPEQICQVILEGFALLQKEKQVPLVFLCRQSLIKKLFPLRHIESSSIFSPLARVGVCWVERQWYLFGQQTSVYEQSTSLFVLCTLLAQDSEQCMPHTPASLGAAQQNCDE